MLAPRYCAECGRRFDQTREHQAMCSPACRQSANKRRISGGFALYPLVMRWRIERDKDALSALCEEADRLANDERALRRKREARIAEDTRAALSPKAKAQQARDNAALKAAVARLTAELAEAQRRMEGKDV